MSQPTCRIVHAALLLIAIPFLAPAAFAGVTSRVSVDSLGAQSDGQSRAAAVSANRRYVAFSSVATNLVPGDLNGKEDVFVHDRKTGATERVSVGSDGRESDGASYDAAISADGRYVAFESAATNLVSGDLNGRFDVFVCDLEAGTTTLVSVDPSGVPGNGDSVYPSLSSDGSLIAFQSRADNLVAGDRNGVEDVFVRDLPAGSTRRVSVASSGAEGDAQSGAAVLSADGRFVGFRSMASNLVDGDLNHTADLFAHDLASGLTVRVSVSASDDEGNGESHGAALSADGRFVAFASSASNLIQDDINHASDVFVRDRDTDRNGVFDEPGGTTTLRVSEGLGGTLANGASDDPAISATGRRVVFSSFASNLVTLDTNGRHDVFERDVMTRQMVCVSRNTADEQSDGSSVEPAVSADGRLIAFGSDATNLVAGDSNGERDVFVVDRVGLELEGIPQAPNPVSFALTGATGEAGNLAIVLLSCTGAEGFSLPIDGRLVPLTYDSCTSVGLGMLTVLSGLVDENGDASTASFRFPVTSPGMPIYAAAVTLDFGTGGLISISAPLTFMTR